MSTSVGKQVVFTTSVSSASTDANCAARFRDGVLRLAGHTAVDERTLGNIHLTGHEDEVTGPDHRRVGTDAAVNQKQYELLWVTSGFSGEPPEVEVADEVMLRFGATYRDICLEIRIDDLIADRAAGTVAADLVVLGGNRECTAHDNRGPTSSQSS